MSLTQPIDILFVGHVCLDKVGEDFVLGGTASYAALLARNFLDNIGLVTSTAEDFSALTQFEEIQLLRIPASENTVFENKQVNQQRIQWLHSRAATLEATNVMQLLHNFEKPPILFLCPIANEVDLSIARAFPQALKVCTIQGCLRNWDFSGRVFAKAMEWTQLSGIDLVILSEEDLNGHKDWLQKICQQVPLVVMTHGKEGATAYAREQTTHYPAWPTTEVDATGAGDTFATAFVIHYQQTGELASAMAYAHAAASLNVEVKGLRSDWKDLTNRFLEYQRRFLPI